MPTRKNTAARLKTQHKHLQLVTEPGWSEIEGLARTAADTGIGDKERQGALVLLLDSIYNSEDSRDMAFMARNAAFASANELIAPMVDQVLAQLREGRSA